MGDSGLRTGRFGGGSLIKQDSSPKKGDTIEMAPAVALPGKLKMMSTQSPRFDNTSETK